MKLKLFCWILSILFLATGIAHSDFGLSSKPHLTALAADDLFLVEDKSVSHNVKYTTPADLATYIGLVTGTLNTIKEDNVTVDTTVDILDFLGADFDLAESPEGEIQIIIAAALTRDTEAAAAYQPLEATLTDIADGTIAENLVNTAHPWAANEVADDININSADVVTALSVYTGTSSLEETTAADDSGAHIVGVFDELDHSDETNVQGVVDDLDAAIRSGVTFVVAASDSCSTTKVDYLCDGTDDEVQINQAIAALPATGGDIKLLDGTYVVNSQNAIGGSSYSAIRTDKNKVTIFGAGKSTIIKVKDSQWGSGNDSLISYALYSDDDYTIVKDLVIDANKAGQSYGKVVALAFNGSDYCLAKNCIFKNAYGDAGSGLGYGVIIQNADYNRLISCDFLDGDSYCLQIYNGSDYNLVDGCLISGAENCGMHLYKNSTDSTHNIITNCIFKDCGHLGLHLNQVTKNIISNNKMISNGSVQWGGLALEDSSNNTVTGNYLYDNGVGSAYSSIVLAKDSENGSDNNTIVNNFIMDTAGTGYAIEIDGNSTDNYIADNRYKGTGASSVSISAGNIEKRKATDAEMVAQTKTDVYLVPSNLPAMISGMTDTTAVSADYFLFWDATTSKLAKCDGDEVIGGGGNSTAWDDIGAPDANDTINMADYIIQLQLGSSGDFRIGDGGGNYTKFGPFGSMTFHGSAD
ncbi:MAG: right-handed parallel beta-helix repeat-containing protein, partial [Bacteroidetes bacterium]|nr:right-handed parallel beta-helix repeat-containing protein [Bacteroidota bacterium]